jgi:epsilon-lactone hydrolase
MLLHYGLRGEPLLMSGNGAICVAISVGVHDMKSNRSIAVAAFAGALVIGASMRLSAQSDPVMRTTFAKDGTVHVPAFDLPPSSFASNEAADALKARAGTPAFDYPPNLDIKTMRMGMEALLSPAVKLMESQYPADIVQQSIAGVSARVVTPKGVSTNRARVLINLHGGGFSLCADACAILESLPIAAVGGYKVISVNYRQGPEAKFPAASEDVTAVYRELLKSYKPSQIGIYGCSAGGALSAQVAAWLSAHGLPEPGAIGIFGSGAARFSTGDSAYLAGYIDGSFPPPPPAGTAVPPSALMKMMMSYFEGIDSNDPLVSPAGHLDVLAKFPPTLVITGTRAPDMSPAIYTHSQLIKAGVPGDLIVGEGLGHCYIYSADLPEAKDAYSAIAKFFQKNLH